MTLQDVAVLPVEDDKVCPANDGIFDDRDAHRAPLGVVQAALGREIVPAPPVETHPADDGLSVQGPPSARKGFAPKIAVLAGDELAGGRCKGPQVVFAAVRVDADEPPGRRLSFLEGEINAVDPESARVVRRIGGDAGDLLHRHKRRPGVGLFRPDGVEAFLDFPEGLFEGLAGDAADIALQRGDGEGFAGDAVEIIGRKHRPVIEIAHSRDGHIADGVIVRSRVLEGAVHPFVPVAPVAVVEGDGIEAEEIGRASASGDREGGFGHDGVAFQERRRREQGRDGARPHLAHEDVHPAEGLPVGQLHLGDVAGLVDAQLRHPGLGDGGIGLRLRVQVHPLGRPGHRAVGIGMVGVQDDGQPAPVAAPGSHSGAPAHDGPPALQVDQVGAGQGVQALRIDDAVMLRAEGGPTAEGIGPVLVELGRCRRPCEEGGQDEKGPAKCHKRREAPWRS